MYPGGEAGGSGLVGGACGTSNVATWLLRPWAIDRTCPKPLHSAPFHPSPYESAMFRVHDDPLAVLILPAKGEPPDREEPSSHERAQLTSEEKFPGVTAMLKEESPGGGGEYGGRPARGPQSVQSVP